MISKWVLSFVSVIFLMMCIMLQAKAVEYELPDTHGQIQSFDQYKGKWVIVNYWATWCGTCMKELPELAAFHENNKDSDAVVVGINFEFIESDNLKRFVTDKSIPYTVLSTKPVRETPLGNVPALPTTYIIDPQGKVVAGEVGIVTQENLENYIKQKKG